MINFKQFFLEQAGTVAILPGGFKPPHKGHFEALKYLINSNNATSAKVFIGGKERDGFTADISKSIWDIYAKYLPVDTTVDVASVTPVKSVYDYVDQNPTGGYVVGAGEEDQGRYAYFAKNQSKYPNTKVVAIPPQFGRISGTTTRQKILSKTPDALDFIPDEINTQDKEAIKHLLKI